MGYRPDLQQPLDQNDYNCCNTCSRISRRQNPRLKFCVAVISIVTLIFFIGKIDLSFYTTTKLDIKTGLSSFPVDVGDFPRVVDLYKAGRLNDSSVKPINLRYANVDFLVNPQVESHVGLLVIVKSARQNYEKRTIIRKTWGDKKYLEENALAPNLPTKVFFICGKSDSEEVPEDLERDLKLENSHQDIIVAGFNDSYSNNTYKSMLAFKWALTEFGGDFKFLALFDDDIYVDMVNLGSLLRELKYKRVIKIASSYSGFPYLRFTPRRDEMSLAVPDIPTGLYMGAVYTESTPERNYKSKWYTSYDDYNYNMFPPYVPGAGMILNHKAVLDMYYASQFLQHLWIDDVYLGIVAAKLGIAPLHSPHFLARLTLNTNLSHQQISEIIIMHGFECTQQILDFWNKRSFKDLFICPKKL